MKVSVWIGNAKAWDILDDCLTFRFTEDGDAIPCEFAKAFGIDWFDDDYREASVSGETDVSATQLLQRHSLGSSISDAVCTQSGGLPCERCNAVVVLYDFQYSGSARVMRIQDVTLFFIGTFDIPGFR